MLSLDPPIAVRLRNPKSANVARPLIDPRIPRDAVVRNATNVPVSQVDSAGRRHKWYIRFFFPLFRYAVQATCFNTFRAVPIGIQPSKSPAVSLSDTAVSTIATIDVTFLQNKDLRDSRGRETHADSLDQSADEPCLGRMTITRIVRIDGPVRMLGETSEPD